MSRMPRTRLPLWAAGTTLLLSLAACGAGGYAQTPLSPTPTAAATTSAAPTTAAPTPAASKCNPVPAGFNPLALSPGGSRRSGPVATSSLECRPTPCSWAPATH